MTNFESMLQERDISPYECLEMTMEMLSARTVVQEIDNYFSTDEMLGCLEWIWRMYDIESED